MKVSDEVLCLVEAGAAMGAIVIVCESIYVFIRFLMINEC